MIQMLRRMRASGDPDPDRPCSFPGCGRVALLGDGPMTPCWPHVLQLGHAAADPDHLSEAEATLLLEAHGDVVELVTHTTVTANLTQVASRWRWLE